MPPLNTYRGEWEPLLAYYASDQVSYGGVYYVNLTPRSINQQPDVTPAAWQQSGSQPAVAGSTPPGLVAPVTPSLFTSLLNPGSGTPRAVRVVVPQAGILHDVAVLIGTPSGNIDVGVYDTGDAVAGTRTQLWHSGTTVCPGAGWQIIGDPALAVKAGQQLDLVINADNVTVTVGRAALAANNQCQLPNSFWPAAGGAKPYLAWAIVATFPLAAAYTEASITLNGSLYAIIARVV